MQAGDSWGFLSASKFNVVCDPKQPIMIDMADGHTVYLAASLFRVSPATYAMARMSIASVSAGSKKRTAAAAAAQ